MQPERREEQKQGDRADGQHRRDGHEQTQRQRFSQTTGRHALGRGRRRRARFGQAAHAAIVTDEALLLSQRVGLLPPAFDGQVLGRHCAQPLRRLEDGQSELVERKRKQVR